MRANVLITLKQHARWPLYFLAALLLALCIQPVKQLLALRLQIKSLMTLQHHTSTPAATLADWHLFGISSNMKDLPLSNLPLSLQGISFLGKSSVDNRAIISDNTGAAKSYRQGDSLPHGAVIKAILPNQVNIEHNNQLERLVIPTTNLKEYRNAEPILPS